eukprot:725450-Rhodomonas_salina.2
MPLGARYGTPGTEGERGGQVTGEVVDGNKKAELLQVRFAPSRRVLIRACAAMLGLLAPKRSSMPRAVLTRG